MAPKMRGSLTDAAKAKKKDVEDEKKMSSLQQWQNRIRKAKLNEHNWPKHWDEIREWGKSKGA